MANGITQRYTPGGVSLTTRTPGLGAVPGIRTPTAGGGGDMASFFEEMVRRREDERLEERRRAMAERDAPQRRGVERLGGARRGGFGYGGMMGMMPRPNRPVLGMSRDPNRGLRQEAERQGLMTQVQQAGQARRPAPMRMVHGPGIIPGQTMDVNAMSATQRQLFLPSASGEQFSPEQAAMAGVRGQREADWYGGMAADRERARTFGSGAAPGAGGMQLSPEEQQAWLQYLLRNQRGG
jgi:hypothetical protein